MLFEQEHIEFLSPTVGVIVSPAHTFGTDALLLADFAAPKRDARACDFGTGCGILPFYWQRSGLCSRIDGIELQAKACAQFARGIARNALQDKVFAHQADLKTASDFLPRGTYDLVTMNPPYQAANTGRLSENLHAQIARHEVLCTFEDIAASAARLLRFGGRFCVCIRPERLAACMAAMQSCRLEPKRLRMVAKNPQSQPWLCLLEGRLGGKSGLRVLPMLFLFADDNHAYSAEFLRICGTYADSRRCE